MGSLTEGPVELVRIRLQTQPAKNRLYTGPIDCIKKLYSRGGIRALYRGMGPTVGREGHGMGYACDLKKTDRRMYFLTYESLIHTNTSKGMKREDIPPWKLCLYGALSGEAMWLASYPIGMN